MCLRAYFIGTAQWVPETRISLSWKSLSSRSEVLTKLHQFLAVADKDSEIMVDLAATQSKFSVFMEDVNDPLAMGTKRISRYSKPCKKSVTRHMVCYPLHRGPTF